MNYISLFSGIGGFDLGFDRAGMKCLAQVEIDEDARRVLFEHWPAVPKFSDVKEFGNAQFKRGTVDVICGGFPCQDLSVAGKRAGLSGERSGLWFEFARIIDEIEPRWVVIENVPGLLSSWSGPQPPSDLADGQEWETEEESDLSIIFHWLVERGYGLSWRILDAQYFGLAQRRRRVFVVASLGTLRASQILFEPESLRRDTPPRRQTRTRLATDTAASLRNSGYGSRGWTGDNEQGLVDFNNFGERDTSTALSSKNQRLDGDTETFVVNAFNGYTGGADDNDAQANHLVIAQNGSDIQITDKPGALGAEARHTNVDVVAFSAIAQSGAGWAPASIPTNEDQALPLDATRAQAVAFTERTRPDGRSLEFQADLAYSLDNPGEGGRSLSRAVAFMAGQSAEARSIAASEHTSPTLRHSPSGTNQVPSVSIYQDSQYGAQEYQTAGTLREGRPPHHQMSVSSYGVRRLTPVECERLQGFPDSWTAIITQRVKKMSGHELAYYRAHLELILGPEVTDEQVRSIVADSIRYRQLGNAVAVPVAEWIGKRLMAEEHQP